MDYINKIGFLPLLNLGISGWSADDVVDEDCGYTVFPDGSYDLSSCIVCRRFWISRPPASTGFVGCARPSGVIERYTKKASSDLLEALFVTPLGFKPGTF